MLTEDLHIMDVSNTTELFGIIVPRKGESEDESEEPDKSGNSLPPATIVNPTETMKWYEQMVYHQVLIDKSYAAANIEIAPTNPDSELLLFFNYKYKPLPDAFELMIPLRVIKGKMVNGTYDIFLGNDIINNRTGFFYLGVAEVNATELESTTDSYLLDSIVVNPNISQTVNFTALESNYTLPGLRRNFTTDYSLRIFTSGCYFFDYKQRIWTGEGCYVREANKDLTYCKCNHLTSFGAGFFVMPNTVDFSYVFANAGFADNVTIYMTIMITMVIYALLIVWARAQDRKDLEKLGATPLPDNDSNDKYLYEITAYTGDKDGAGTESKVFFILSGDDDETEVRSLTDPKRQVFKRGSKDVFVMAVPSRLGRLNYLRIWHDNSGRGKMRSWLLSYIVVRDIHTNERFEFICNKWLAVEKGDGVIDRLLPVAGLGEATEFSHLFHQKSQKSLKDGHLWFSVFMRPPTSRFTRVQRVSCCMALLYLSMLVNAMWYERVPPKPRSSALEIGPFSLSPEQIGVGFFSNLIVFPPTFLIIFFFRRSRLRKLRPSRIQEALVKQGLPLKSSSSGTTSQLAADKLTCSTTTLIGAGDNSTRRKSLGIKKEGKKGKSSPKLLPYWCRYIGWFLCIASILVSIFFLWAYGIQFGDDKTRKWVTSLIVSFFASILVTQPVKVFMTAIILSTLFKSPDSDVDEGEEDEEELDLELGADEEWLHTLAGRSPTGGRRGKKDRSKMYRPPNLTALEKAKLERLKEIKMAIILKEIGSYLFFLWILIVLSYGNRDPNAFLMKDTLKSTFIMGANTGTSFADVKSSQDLWNWIQKTLVPELLVGPWYNTKQPYGLRGFLNDRVNRMMGYGVLRQVRIRERNNCKVVSGIKKSLSSDREVRCRKFSSMIYEDRKSYSKGWNHPNMIHQLNEQQKLPSSSGGVATFLSAGTGASSTSSFSLNDSYTTDNNREKKYNSLENTALKMMREKEEEMPEGDDESIVDDPETEESQEPIEESIITRIEGEEDLFILNPSKSSKNEWSYRKPSELDGLPFWGLLDMYSGGGYLVPLKGSRSDINLRLDQLKNDSWIDSRTRAVFSEFSVYNAQVNLFAVITIIGELQPGGGVIPNYRIDVVRLIRYHQGFGLFVILCELTYVAFIVYFTVREYKRWRTEGREYFKSYWNWAEMIVIFFSYAGMVLYVYRMILTNRILKIFDRTKGNGYVKLQYVTSIDESFGLIIAFTIFIGILKFIRLLRFNKRMGMLYSTLDQCSKDLKSFCVIFTIVFMAFTQLFYILFGIHMTDFSSFINSAETTFGMMTGKFDFDSMVRASPLLGPIAFFIFVLIASIILLNIFLTLIISAFETVKHDLMKQSNEFEIVDFILKKAKEMIGFDTSSGSVSPDLRQQIQSESALNTIEHQVSSFPEKLDRLLELVNQKYYDGKLNLDTSEDQKTMRLRSAFRRKQRYGWRKGSVQSGDGEGRGSSAMRSGRVMPNRPGIMPFNDIPASHLNLQNNNNHHPKIAILDWMEVENETDAGPRLSDEEFLGDVTSSRQNRKRSGDDGKDDSSGGRVAQTRL